jgi:enoyl-CoA hydratase/carnithine racemase
MAYDNLTVETKNHIATITIDHPPANAWDLTTMEAFEKAVDTVEKDSEVRTVILTGAGQKCFSAGFDVRDAANANVISPKGRELWRRIDRFGKPVIAAINGYAMGGGLELAMACHFRIMADAPHVLVGLTELNLGIIPGWGGTQRLPRLVGRSKAIDMILFSHRLNAAQALEAGLVDRLVPPEKLANETVALAAQLAERPPIAVRCVLNALTAGIYNGFDAGLQVEAEGSATVRETKDRNEGFAAFLEKRKPRFIGR